MNCVLYFGSFNPFHIGHAAIAQYVAKQANVDELCLVLSPHNPFKDLDQLQDANLRWQDILRVIEKLNNSTNNLDSGKYTASNIEFTLPQPNYTYNTLEAFKHQYPDKNFSILMGADNLNILTKWYKGEQILKNYKILVYPREGFNTKKLCAEYGATFIDAPQINISSTQIREMEQKGMDTSKLKF